MKLLILGGSPHHPGGVEAFCDRAKAALETHRDWQVEHRPTRSAYLSLRRLPSFLSGLLRMGQYLWRRPDCVWLQYVTLPDLTYVLVARLMGLKVVVTPHLGSNWRSQANPTLRSISNWMLSHAHSLALLSKTQEREVRFPEAVPKSYIRTFLPASIFATPLPDLTGSPAELQLIHSGRLSEGKGTFLFVEVCAKLQLMGVPFFARIVGGTDDATFARLKQMIANCKLEKKIALPGRLPNEELVPLLSSSDFLIHLSRIDSYPLIVLEAAACSAFPVCMELPGARDMIETYYGHLVPAPASGGEVAAFLSSQDLEQVRTSSQSAALRVRSDYEWEACVQALETALGGPTAMPLALRADSAV